MGYDGLGRRVYRTVGTSRQDYWYDQSGLVRETGGTNATYLRTPSGRPLSRYVSVPYDYSLDRLGSVTMMTTGQGSAGTYTYDPWGNEVGSSATTYNPIRYTGSYRDSSTSMYQMGARYYDPNVGRFTQSDPLGGGYPYVSDNPVNHADPTGLFCAGGYAGANAETGIGFFGAAGRAGAGGGVCTLGAPWDRGGPSVWGFFTEAGGFIGTPWGGLGYPSGSGFALGDYLGVGGGPYLSNATSFAQLSGPFQTYSVDTPFGSVSLSMSGKTWVFSITGGGGELLGYTSYQTNTWIP